MMKQSNLLDVSGFNPQKAWIVFTNQTDLPWLGIFKDGFRHCFVLIHDGQNWISIDPMANYMEVVVHTVPADFNLTSWLEDRGHHVIKAELARDIKKSAPIMLFTCVEACKRILGIHNRFIFTPWQLFRYLLKEQEREHKNLKHKGDLAWEV